jgi:hypothetical protein
VRGTKHDVSDGIGCPCCDARVGEGLGKRAATNQLANHVNTVHAGAQQIDMQGAVEDSGLLRCRYCRMLVGSALSNHEDSDCKHPDAPRLSQSERRASLPSAAQRGQYHRDKAKQKAEADRMPVAPDEAENQLPPHPNLSGAALVTPAPRVSSLTARPLRTLSSVSARAARNGALRCEAEHRQLAAEDELHDICSSQQSMPSEPQFMCDLCGTDMAGWDAERRIRHVNQCDTASGDDSEQEGESQAAERNEEGGDAAVEPGAQDLPIAARVALAAQQAAGSDLRVTPIREAARTAARTAAEQEQMGNAVEAVEALITDPSAEAVTVPGQRGDATQAAIDAAAETAAAALRRSRGSNPRPPPSADPFEHMLAAVKPYPLDHKRWQLTQGALIRRPGIADNSALAPIRARIMACWRADPKDPVRWRLKYAYCCTFLRNPPNGVTQLEAIKRRITTYENGQFAKLWNLPRTVTRRL